MGTGGDGVDMAAAHDVGRAINPEMEGPNIRRSDDGTGIWHLGRSGN